MEKLFLGELVNSSRILYTPSSFAKSSLCYLQEIGKLSAQKPHISKRDNLDSFLFFIVTDGEGTLSYNGKIYPLKTGDSVFIDCKNEYSHKTSDNLWSLQWIHFYGNNVQDIYDKYIDRGGQPVFRTDNPDILVELWNKIYGFASSEDYIKDMKINECIYSLLTLIMAESWHPESISSSNSKKQNLLDIKLYLDNNFREKITLEMLSEIFFINKFYLTRVFKEQFGTTINSYIIQLRITDAKHMLRFTNKTIEEIGLECGIGPLHYFSRAFKKIEGISPNEYRKKW